MGRREVSPQDHARWVFNRLAEHYRARPGYPEQLIDRLVALALPARAGGRGDLEAGAERVTVEPGGRRAAEKLARVGGSLADDDYRTSAGAVVELGAGTGVLALALARRGLRVTAVEPARAMLDVLEEEARRENVGVHPIHAAAERTGLSPGFGLAVLADAAQWVDPELAGAELARLLEPDGVLAVVQPSFAATPFMDRVRERLARENPKAKVRARDDTQLFTLAIGQGPVHEERFEHSVRMDAAQLDAVLRSISYVGPALGEERLHALLADVREIAREEDPVWSRVITLRWARPSR